MAYVRIMLFLLVFVLSPGYPPGLALADDYVVPTPKNVRQGQGFFQAGSVTRLEVSPDFRAKYASPVRHLEKFLQGLPASGAESSIVVAASIPPGDPAAKQIPPGKEEAYIIRTDGSKVHILGRNALSALHGMAYVEAMLRNGDGRMKRGGIVNWPDLKVRAVHLVIAPGISPEDIKAQIDRAYFGHFNTLILQMKNFVRLKSMGKAAPDNAWSVPEFLEVAGYARENGLEFVPELKTLTHQETLIGREHRGLLFGKRVYDPSKKEVYDVIFPILSELIDLVHPDNIHIGHDEGDVSLPADLFLEDVNRIHQFLRGKGVGVWMWGDMLISPAGFPSMNPKFLHGNADYVKMRHKLPKDIVICDWHYNEPGGRFPSSQAFAEEGFKVLGATWQGERMIKSFSAYIADLPKNGEGMIATTWFGALKHNTNRLYGIIASSGDAFWNAKRSR